MKRSHIRIKKNQINKSHIQTKKSQTKVQSKKFQTQERLHYELPDARTLHRQNCYFKQCKIRNLPLIIFLEIQIYIRKDKYIFTNSELIISII